MIRSAIAAAALLSAAPAGARAVDYAIDDVAMRAAAAELKITPIASLPDRGDATIALTVDPAADHVTLALGMYCSAYKVENPISRLMAGLVPAWAKDGQVAGAGQSADIHLKIASARSYRRCLEVGEMKTRCITKTSIAGSVEAGGRSLPVAGTAEREATVGGFCGNLAKGIGVVSREAAIALIADARAKALSLAATPIGNAEPLPASAR